MSASLCLLRMSILERVVPNSPLPGEEFIDYWPLLEQSLVRCRDAAALNSLGNAFKDRPLGNLRANNQHAERCCRSSLEIYKQQGPRTKWAETQNNLGNILSDQASLEGGTAQAVLLGQALAAYSTALEVFTEADMPAKWAGTQNNIGTVFADLADLVEANIRVMLLEQAVGAFRGALKVRSQFASLADWAGTQSNLGNVLRRQAKLVDGVDRIGLLEQSVQAHHAALANGTREVTPTKYLSE